MTPRGGMTPGMPGQTPGRTPIRDRLNINEEDMESGMFGQVCSPYFNFLPPLSSCGAIATEL